MARNQMMLNASNAGNPAYVSAWRKNVLKNSEARVKELTKNLSPSGRRQVQATMRRAAGRLRWPEADRYGR